MEHIFTAGFREFAKHRKQGSSSVGDARQRAPRDARRVPARDRRARGATSGLATVGSVSPYIGLFGTVWGIMNAFRGLANVSQATLANVAPGIAEALIATAIGLFAAIPAVIALQPVHARRRPARDPLRDVHRGILATSCSVRDMTSRCADRAKSINQINVVPYIDVMLVLLVIFMVTAPLVNPGEIELPSRRQQARRRRRSRSRSRCATTCRCGCGTRRRTRRPCKVSRDELVARILRQGRASRSSPSSSQRTRARATKTCSAILDLLQRNGVKKVGLLARPPAT